MAHLGIGKRKSHYLWIVLGVVAVLAIAYTWTNVY
jgi:hypothetical protein